MDDDVHALVLRPFCEIVEGGNAALVNHARTGAALPQTMERAAQALIKDGERALRKMEPVCRKLLDEYGTGFVDALKDNDEIARVRIELDDALFDFDEYTDTANFDGGKFADLQALSRKAALRISEILIRMKLDHPQPDIELSAFSLSRAPSTGSHSHSSSRAELSPVSAPLLSPFPEGGNPRNIWECAQCQSLLEVSAESESLSGEAREHELLDQPVMSTQAGPVLSWESRQSVKIAYDTPWCDGTSSVSVSAAPSHPTPPYRSDEVPAEPQVNPWGRRIVKPPDGKDIAGDGCPERRPSAASVRFGASGPSSEFFRRGVPSARTAEQPIATADSLAVSPISASASLSGLRHAASVNSASSKHTPPSGSTRDDVKPVSGAQIDSPIIWEQPPKRDLSHQSGTDSPAQSYIEEAISEAWRIEGIRSDGQPMNRSSFNQSGESLQLPGSRKGSTVKANMGSLPLKSPSIRLLSTQPGAQDAQSPIEQPGLELVAVSNPEPEDGLIPVARLGSDGIPIRNSQQPARHFDCTIGLTSSYNQLKGFCDGAKEIVRGGLGIRKIKKPGIGAGTIVVAKCVSCMFELDWRSVEPDLNKEDSGNYTTCGVGFRLRFISKSHIRTRHIDEQTYGCIFCIQLGRTIEESDATVFFSQRQLFAHIARHPRPLPEVSGLTVIEAPHIPPHLKNNYDIHLTQPPARSNMNGIAKEINAMPTAVAIETVRAFNNTLRSPPGSQHHVLQFAVGAKIVGIEFPAKYGGEWAMGWTDNMRGIFPTDSVRLEAPLRSHILVSPSNMRAFARWKRNPREKDHDDWLKFDKAEVITGITYPYQEHWCWAGYNSKGKWGIFPQAYMEPNTLSEMTPIKKDPMGSEEKPRVFSRLTLRRHPWSAKS